MVLTAFWKIFLFAAGTLPAPASAEAAGWVLPAGLPNVLSDAVEAEAWVSGETAVDETAAGAPTASIGVIAGAPKPAPKSEPGSVPAGAVGAEASSEKEDGAAGAVGISAEVDKGEDTGLKDSGVELGAKEEAGTDAGAGVGVETGISAGVRVGDGKAEAADSAGIGVGVNVGVEVGVKTPVGVSAEVAVVGLNASFNPPAGASAVAAGAPISGVVDGCPNGLGLSLVGS